MSLAYKLMKRLTPLLIAAALLMTGCGTDTSESSGASSTPATPAGLTEAQLEHGIGPISAFEPGPLDATLADKGMDIFKLKCSACHKMEGRYVGPELGIITKERSPAYLMNMMLNPAEMIEKHPEAKKKFAEYMTPMPSQNLTEDEARAILEYLRREADSR